MSKTFNMPKFFRTNLIVISLFLFSTAFLLYQHSTGTIWDFASYVLNAKFLFANGFYFEWLRPPLMPFLLGIFSLFGWLVSEYFYIVFVSVLHLFASVKLAKICKIKKEIFYALTLTPFLLNFGLLAGPYLLAFALLELSMAFLLEKKSSLSGIFLGLTVLAHYTTIIFLPLLLFNKKLRNIMISFLFFLFPLLPWLLFSQLTTGNFLTSFFDSYFLNISARQTFSASFAETAKQVLLFGNYYLLLFTFGLFYAFKKKKFEFFLFLSFAALALVSFLKIPFKHPVYLFNFLLPLAYFSSLALEKIKKEKMLPIILIVIITNFFFAINFFPFVRSLDYYKNALNKTDECMGISNEWVYLNYLGRPTTPPISISSMQEFTDEGYKIIYFKKTGEQFYKIDELKEFPVLFEDSEYLILGREDRCKKYEKVVHSITKERFGRFLSIEETFKFLFYGKI